VGLAGQVVRPDSLNDCNQLKIIRVELRLCEGLETAIFRCVLIAPTESQALLIHVLEYGREGPAGLHPTFLGMLLL